MTQTLSLSLAVLKYFTSASTFALVPVDVPSDMTRFEKVCI
jgi:hypothetical protein